MGIAHTHVKADILTIHMKMPQLTTCNFSLTEILMHNTQPYLALWHSHVNVIAAHCPRLSVFCTDFLEKSLLSRKYGFWPTVLENKNLANRKLTSSEEGNQIPLQWWLATVSDWWQHTLGLGRPRPQHCIHIHDGYTHTHLHFHHRMMPSHITRTGPNVREWEGTSTIQFCPTCFHTN